jgi:hypothetical protein
VGMRRKLHTEPHYKYCVSDQIAESKMDGTCYTCRNKKSIRKFDE